MNDQVRTKALRRMKIIRGQVEGLERMIEQDKYCIDVLTQMAAVQQALRGVGKLIVRQHLDHCVTAAVKRGDESPHYDELMDIMTKLTK